MTESSNLDPAVWAMKDLLRRLRRGRRIVVALVALNLVQLLILICSR